MGVQTTKVSTKGQVVIPDSIRADLHIETGDVFAVIGSNDTICLKKISVPTKKQLLDELKSLTKGATKKLKEKGITEQDVIKMSMKKR